jgi:SAM-dependent methyltransferase
MKPLSDLVRSAERTWKKSKAMSAFLLNPRLIAATKENFIEEAYLRANPDVAKSVSDGVFRSGRHHFDTFGAKEGRKLMFDPHGFEKTKSQKLERIRPLLREDLPCVETSNAFDFLSEALRKEFDIVDTSKVSSNEYDKTTRDLVQKHSTGLVLDCGAGSRAEYFENVVNFEIVPYRSTDVRGVGEVLPFKDASFDAVISIAVLEHVKDPFRCATELLRVLKPGGDIVCAVPFLQPYHGYPHHYYNMSAQGLVNLFGNAIAVDALEVPDSTLPIWSLSWIIQSWAAGLKGSTRDAFLKMSVADFLSPPNSHMGADFVRKLSRDKNFELASACVLVAHKKPAE